jgi:hypothetical protein
VHDFRHGHHHDFRHDHDHDFHLDFHHDHQGMAGPGAGRGGSVGSPRFGGSVRGSMMPLRK